MGMDGYNGPADVTLATGDHVGAEVNLHQARDGEHLSGAINVPPQFEHKFNDGDTVTVSAGEESGEFKVTGTVLFAGPKAGCFAVVKGDWS
jgi:hypothetical protein